MDLIVCLSLFLTLIACVLLFGFIRLAGYDVLTKIPNRLWFNKRLQKAIRRAKKSGRFMALFYVDIDQFKIINNSLGHPIGDMLLQAFAKRLQFAMRSSDYVVRLGGDEFAVIVNRLKDRGDMARIASKLITKLSAGYNIENHKISITASIGIACYPEAGEDSMVLIKQADAALYAAKAAGRNSYQCLT